MGRRILKSEQPNGLDGSVGRGFDALGEIRPWPTNPVQYVVEVGVWSSSGPGHIGDRESCGEKSFLQFHTCKDDSVTLPCQAPRVDCRSQAVPGHDRSMDAFHQALKSYQLRTGKTQSPAGRGFFVPEKKDGWGG